MRIVSGTYGGRIIQMDSRLSIRPTSDKARGAVFSSLAQLVPGARFLDICAGTGAMGLEALSRGALRVTAIERSTEAVQLIRANREQLGIPCEALRVIKGEYEKILPRLPPEKFDLIFADPPYGYGHPSEILLLVERHDLLYPDGVLVIEHFAKECLPRTLGKLHLSKAKHYGQTTMSYFAPQEANA